MHTLGILLPFFWWCTAHAADLGTLPEVQTSFGKIVGKSIKTIGGICERYAGIPFAQRPLGNLRFEKPVPWSAAYSGGALNASTYKDMCTLGQTGRSRVMKGSEDCLYLNIFKPDIQDIEALPIVLWIHGGSFLSGNADWPSPVTNTFDGCKLAVPHKVILVTTNYRLGPWGFLATDSDSGDGIEANIGLEDQREAMRWVKQQSTSLGGDPGRITIVGESAGAISVQLHSISPLSAGLFQHGVSESGAATIMNSAEKGINITRVLATRLGCPPLQGSALKRCLRNFTTKQIFAVIDDNPVKVFQPDATHWWPVVDGLNFPEHPVALMLKKKFNPNVTMIVGSNTDEANLFTLPPLDPWQPLLLNRSTYETTVEKMVLQFDDGMGEAQVKQVLEAYPGSDAKDNHRLLSSLLTDFVFLCSSRLLASYHPRTYAYRFDHRPAWVPKYFGIPHGLEIPYVFDHLPFKTAKEEALSHQMGKLWTHLAYSGSPTHHTADKTWPTWEDETKQNVRFDAGFALNQTLDIEDSYRNKECTLFFKLWNEVYPVAKQVSTSILV